jgi:hypothetical protein
MSFFIKHSLSVFDNGNSTDLKELLPENPKVHIIGRIYNIIYLSDKFRFLIFQVMIKISLFYILGKT